MKIDRLITLSQFVDIVTDNNNEEWTNEDVIKYANEYMETDLVVCAIPELISKYNNFLKQPLTKEMFVNEINIPTLQYSDPMYYEAELHVWNEAENKVIFEGFNKSQYYAFNYICDNIRINLENNCFPKLEYLLKPDSHQIKTLHDLAESTKGQLNLKNVEL